MSTDVMTDASSRKLSCKRQEARAEAVLGARRPGGRPSWTPGGPSGGRLGRQEAHPEAAAPGGPSGGLWPRRPKVPYKYMFVTIKMQGFRRHGCTRRQAVRRQGCTRRQGVSGVQKRQAELRNFCIDDKRIN